MGTLSVWKFDTAEGAGQAVGTLEGLAKQQLITILDAATVSWPEGAKRPKTRELHNLAGAGALGGAFWGLLFGLLFFIPVFGMALGAGMGALMGKITKSGIDRRFQEQVRDMVQPGTSALFLIVEKVTPDKAVESLSRFGGTVLKSSLSKEQEAELQAALHGEQAPASTATQ
jgi:uncharacterized membrane protein